MLVTLEQSQEKKGHKQSNGTVININHYYSLAVHVEAAIIAAQTVNVFFWHFMNFSNIHCSYCQLVLEWLKTHIP